MPQIKKAYTDIVEFLQNNEDQLVADILPHVVQLASAKAGGGGGAATKFHKNDEGTVVAIFCYYHKLWMSPADVDFGAKASSPTGFNSMCKEGVSNWTKQQRQYKSAQGDLLTQVAAGELAPEDLADAMLAAEEARDEVKPREDGYGYESLEDLLAA